MTLAVLAGFLTLLPVTASTTPSPSPPVDGTIVTATGDEVTVEADGHRHTLQPQEVWTGGRRVTLGYAMPGDDVHFDGRRLMVTPSGIGGGVAAVRGGDLLLSTGELLSPSPSASTLVDGSVSRLDWNSLPVGAMACARQSVRLGRVGTLDVLSARPEAQAGPVHIDEVRLQGSGTLRVWDTVKVVMRGTPKHQAFLRIAGLCRYLPAREVSPGTYAATFQCIPDVDLAETRVVGRIDDVTRVGDRVSLIPSPPHIESPWPADGAKVPHGVAVYAQLSSLASYVDTSTIHLQVDGTDVTRSAVVTPGLVYWQPTPSLAPGAHRVALRLRDAVGNSARTAWVFEVLP